MKVKAKRFVKYYDQCRLPKWVMVLGIVLLVFGIVAAGVTAIFHDKYSSIFGAWETALTNVWFIFREGYTFREGYRSKKTSLFLFALLLLNVDLFSFI